MGRSGLSAFWRNWMMYLSSSNARMVSSLMGIDLADFVRCAEAVEEMDERNARFERGDLRNERQIERLPARSWKQSIAHPVERHAITSE